MLQAPPGVTGSSHVDRLVAEGRFAEAADEVEKTLATDPRAGLTAGFLRTQARDEAHAWRHFEVLLQRTDLRAADREEGQMRQDALVASTRELAVLLDVTMHATVVARRTDEQLPPLEWPVVDGKATIRLDEHDWEVTVQAPGLAPQRRAVGGQEAVHLLRFAMAPKKPAEGLAGPPAARPAVKRKLPGEMVAGAVMLPIGVVALGGVVAMLPGYVRTRNAFHEREAELAGRPATTEDLDALRGLWGRAQHKEAVMAGFGVTAALGVVIGAIFMGQGRRSQQRQLRLEARPGAAILGLSGRF